jgi:hypothetical protein
VCGYVSLGVLGVNRLITTDDVQGAICGLLEPRLLVAHRQYGINLCCPEREAPFPGVESEASFCALERATRLKNPVESHTHAL